MVLGIGILRIIPSPFPWCLSGIAQSEHDGYDGCCSEQRNQTAFECNGLGNRSLTDLLKDTCIEVVTQGLFLLLLVREQRLIFPESLRNLFLAEEGAQDSFLLECGLTRQ